MRQVFAQILLSLENLFMGARRGGRGGSSPSETEKIVVEKWCHFPVLYKMTEVQEDGIENG